MTTVTRVTAEERQEQLLAELLELGEDVEREALEAILQAGFDQGCFIRPNADDLVNCPPDRLDEHLDALRERVPQGPRIDDPFERVSLEATGIEGRERGYVILTQRCDLIRSIADEPFVELASARYRTEDDLIHAARMGSPRWAMLAHEDEGAWIVDLRSRTLLPKHMLPTLGSPVLPLAPGKERRGFADRVSRRHYRQAVPTDIIDQVQRPLAEHLKKSNKRRRQTEPFSDILARRDGDGVRLLGVLDSNAGRAQATAAFHEILAGLQSKAGTRIAEESTAVTIGDLTMEVWFDDDTYRLDMDHLTWSSKASEQAAEPTR